jgi:hypothetical protein
MIFAMTHETALHAKRELRTLSRRLGEHMLTEHERNVLEQARQKLRASPFETFVDVVRDIEDTAPAVVGLVICAVMLVLVVFPAWAVHGLSVPAHHRTVRMHLYPHPATYYAPWYVPVARYAGWAGGS